MELEEVFYVMGIITMSLMLILMISLVAAVVTIKIKINHLHRLVTEKLETVAGVATTAKNFIKKRV